MVHGRAPQWILLGLGEYYRLRELGVRLDGPERETSGASCGTCVTLLAGLGSALVATA